VEIWEDEKGIETILPPQNKLVQNSEGNEKKGIPRSRLQQNKDKLHQGTQ
jgi:hypothetical protein